jgi:hypothetical protein
MAPRLISFCQHLRRLEALGFVFVAVATAVEEAEY